MILGQFETYSNFKKGDGGDKFYMLEAGSCVAKKKGPQGDEIVVYEYKEGDYFGELALIKDIPR